jgi:hypothetical protein
VTFPRWAFYTPLLAGTPERTQRGGRVTPLRHGVPRSPTRDDFNDALIPANVRAFIESCLDRVKRWERDPRFFGGEPALEDNGLPRETGETEEYAPASAEPSRRRASRRRSRGNNEQPMDALRVTAPCGTRGNPEFRGQPLGDLLQTPQGRRFVEYLATQYRPKGAAGFTAQEAAKALAGAGLTR